jgi:queuine tRNA-ribosyltransferase subunit QTRTD1
MPEKTGEGPRIRGYQVKSVGGGEPKKNLKDYGRLDNAMQKLAEGESGIANSHRRFGRPSRSRLC